jgi:N-acetylmuramoyl-L-alanine amidase
VADDSLSLCWLRRAAAAMALATLLASPARAEDEAPAGPAISAIAARVDQLGAQTRLLFELTGPVKAETFAVAGPKIVVDLPEVAFRLDPVAARPAEAVARKTSRRHKAANRKPENGGASLITSYRFGQFAPGRSRIVIDLTRPAKVVRAESVLRAEGVRLEIDLAPQDAAAFSEAAAAHVRAVAEAAAAPQSPTPAKAREDLDAQAPLVVIDPGHGGVDVGAAGRRGEQEKAIVLEFAKELKAKIEARGRQRVVLTRGDDVFVALDERVRFAREHAAALFLSIHADTLGEPSVAGATLYTLSAHASDAESARVAAKENLADEAAGLVQRAEVEEVGDILFDLARRETRALSREFAAALIAKWREAASLNKNPSRSASFVVLKAPDVPSALLELGYLSSAKDLADLTSPAWRGRAAEGVSEAIDAYFEARRRAARAAVQ